MATTSEEYVTLTKDDLASLVTKRDVADMVSRADLEKLAGKKDIQDLASRPGLEALAVQLDDARCQLLEETKVSARQARQDFDQLWTFLSNPPPDASLPLLTDILAHLRAMPAQRSWRRVLQWPAIVALAGLLGIGSGWWLFTPSRAGQLWARLGERVDAVLVEQGVNLPSINGVYTQLGIATPASRKGKR